MRKKTNEETQQRAQVFSRRLVLAMKAAGMSRMDLAAKTGCSHTTVKAHELGMQGPNLYTMYRYCDALACSVGWLAGEGDENLCVEDGAIPQLPTAVQYCRDPNVYTSILGGGTSTVREFLDAANELRKAIDQDAPVAECFPSTRGIGARLLGSPNKT